MLTAHFLGQLFQFGSDFVLVASLDESHFATTAKQEPRHLTIKTKPTVTVGLLALYLHVLLFFALGSRDPGG